MSPFNSPVYTSSCIFACRLSRTRTKRTCTYRCLLLYDRVICVHVVSLTAHIGIASFVAFLYSTIYGNFEKLYALTYIGFNGTSVIIVTIPNRQHTSGLTYLYRLEGALDVIRGYILDGQKCLQL
jgi:hypothetical protein